MLRLSIAALLALPAASLAQTPPASPAPAAAGAADKQICRRIYETGSLVKSQRICRTADEWRREREAARESTATLQSAPASSGSN